jgi:hypothetical protein
VRSFVVLTVCIAAAVGAFFVMHPISEVRRAVATHLTEPSLGSASAVPVEMSSELQDAKLTPGAVATTDVKLVCSPGYASNVRPRGALWKSLKAEAYARYGIPPGHRSDIDAAGVHHPAYQVDHLIPLEIGGDPTSLENIWPQPTVEAEIKDHVENKLHELVCSGQMPIGVAQQRVRDNWTTAVEK